MYVHMHTLWLIQYHYLLCRSNVAAMLYGITGTE